MRVIDYKSGSNRLSPAEVYQGLKMQLMVYLHAAAALTHEMGQQHNEVVPAGALYFRVYDPIIASSGPLSAAEVAQRQTREYRPEGFVLAQSDVVELMEEGLKGPSAIIPVRVLADGSVSPSESAWTREQYDALSRRLHELIQESAQRMRCGEISIAPVKMDHFVACSHCLYNSVCAFDPARAENSYDHRQNLKPRDIWQRLGVTGGESDDEMD